MKRLSNALLSLCLVLGAGSAVAADTDSMPKGAMGNAEMAGDAMAEGSSKKAMGADAMPMQGAAKDDMGKAMDVDSAKEGKMAGDAMAK